MWTTRQSGLEKQRSASDHRNAYERDRTRLIHSAAFRRLQRKTQIFSAQEGDFHRTRLTHSLEVDSIARSLARNLHYQKEKMSFSLPANFSDFLPSDDLITAIALSHDIGHPPFGHGGESALNYCMQKHGGFESNGQTLRLLTKLETSYNPFGLDLTRRSLLGVLKYPVAYSVLVKKRVFPLSSHVNINHWTPPKCYLDEEQQEVDWILTPLDSADRKLFQSHIDHTTLYQSLDCSIMNVADDIAYGVHDLEDAIHLKLITQEHMDIATLTLLFSEAFPHGTALIPDAKTLLKHLFHLDVAKRKQAIGDLVNGFITAILFIVVHEDFKEPLLRHNVALPDSILRLLEHFKTVVLTHVINSPNSRITEYSGQRVIRDLFDAISSNPEQLLSIGGRENYQQASSEKAKARVICDTIASMTDESAYALHRRLYGLIG